jgi:hypothetical protein
MATTMQTEDALQRAYVNLKSVRNNLSSGYVHEETFYKMFNTAPGELENAGMELAEWRLPANAVGTLDANEFRAKIDAILMYFTIQREKAQIGFHK